MLLVDSTSSMLWLGEGEAIEIRDGSRPASRLSGTSSLSGTSFSRPGSRQSRPAQRQRKSPAPEQQYTPSLGSLQAPRDHETCSRRSHHGQRERRNFPATESGALQAPHDPHAVASYAYVGWTPSGKMPGTICRINAQASQDVVDRLNPPKRPASIAREAAKRKAAARALNAKEVAFLENDICEMEERLKQLEEFNKFDLDGSGAQSVLCHRMR